jgi:hypothetical protein
MLTMSETAARTAQLIEAIDSEIERLDALNPQHARTLDPLLRYREQLRVARDPAPLHELLSPHFDVV